MPRIHAPVFMQLIFQHRSVPYDRSLIATRPFQRDSVQDPPAEQNPVMAFAGAVKIVPVAEPGLTSSAGVPTLQDPVHGALEREVLGGPKVSQLYRGLAGLGVEVGKVTGDQFPEEGVVAVEFGVPFGVDLTEQGDLGARQAEQDVAHDFFGQGQRVHLTFQ
eukprot:TRINITY_DN2834_c0_g1_i1.p2 TRINITY_DN2834_c0_g1~~TRINITY_DN2834_c0_g1_i1.p2  ORF type:complete len:162 (+),score=19.42 TRINITY_DN2834_c0_g1_i1:722-1207(+)